MIYFFAFASLFGASIAIIYKNLYSYLELPFSNNYFYDYVYKIYDVKGLIYNQNTIVGHISDVLFPLLLAILAFMIIKIRLQAFTILSLSLIIVFNVPLFNHQSINSILLDVFGPPSFMLILLVVVAFSSILLTSKLVMNSKMIYFLSLSGICIYCLLPILPSSSLSALFIGSLFSILAFVIDRVLGLFYALCFLAYALKLLEDYNFYSYFFDIYLLFIPCVIACTRLLLDGKIARK